MRVKEEMQIRKEVDDAGSKEAVTHGEEHDIHV